VRKNRTRTQKILDNRREPGYIDNTPLHGKVSPEAPNKSIPQLDAPTPWTPSPHFLFSQSSALPQDEGPEFERGTENEAQIAHLLCHHFSHPD
jgi:hypothetical protein